MALLGWELRKIWRPALLAAIALIGLVFWQIRTEFYIEHLGSSWEDEIGLANRWLEEYGTTIEPAERAELDGQLAEAKAAFSAQVAQLDGAAEAGVRDWPSWLAWEDQYNEDARAERERNRDLYWAVYSNTNCGEIEALETFLERYDRLAAGDASALGHVADWPDWVAEWETRRLEEAAARPEAFGFLPGGVTSDTNDFFHYFAIWCSFSAALLLAPTLVRDRLRRTRAMQWASRRGRGVLGAQMGAALLSGVLLTLVNFAVYLGPFLSTGALTFWNCPMTSVWVQTVPWFDWTYGQYVLALCGLTVALALATSGFTVVLSWFSGAYVSMLLKLLPLVFVLEWGLVPWVMEGAGTFQGSPARLLGLPGGEWMITALCAALALLLCGLVCRRQRRRDLL